MEGGRNGREHERRLGVEVEERGSGYEFVAGGDGRGTGCLWSR